MAFTNIVDIIYPIGTVYTRFSSTSPATLFGGTWTQIKTFLYGQDNAGDTGGTEYHSHTFGIVYGEYYRNLVALSNAGGGATIIETVNNPKYGYNGYNGDAPQSVDQDGNDISSQTTTIGVVSPWVHETNLNTASDMTTVQPTVYSKTGPTSYERVLPPYTTCFIWKRTA